MRGEKKKEAWELSNTNQCSKSIHTTVYFFYKERNALVSQSSKKHTMINISHQIIMFELHSSPFSVIIEFIHNLFHSPVLFNFSSCKENEEYEKRWCMLNCSVFLFSFHVDSRSKSCSGGFDRHAPQIRGGNYHAPPLRYVPRLCVIILL